MYYAKHVWQEFGDKVAALIQGICLSIKALFIATLENVSTMNNWWLLVAYHINCQLSHSEPWASITNLAYPSWLPIDMKDAPWLACQRISGDHTTTNKCVMKYAARRNIWSRSQLIFCLREHKESKTGEGGRKWVWTVLSYHIHHISVAPYGHSVKTSIHPQHIREFIQTHKIALLLVW